MDIVEMLSDEAMHAKLVGWAVKYARSTHNSRLTDREVALRACACICAMWRQAIARDVIADLGCPF